MGCRRVILVWLTLLMAGTAGSQVKQLLPVVVGGKYGLIDSRGNVVMEPAFDMISDFGPDGFAIVRRGNRSGVIDMNGEVVIACVEDSICVLSDSLFAISRGRGWVLTDHRGKALAASVFEELNTTCGEFVQFRRNGMYGLINRQGTEVVPPEYDRFICNGEFIFTYNNGMQGLYNTSGRLLLEAVNDAIIIKNRYLAFYQKDGSMGYVNLYSGRVVTAQWDDVRLLRPYNGGMNASPDYEVVVSREQKQGLFLSANDSLFLEPVYDALQIIYPGYLLCRKKSKAGLVSLSGSVLMEPVYEDISYAGGSFFTFRLRGMAGVADASGKIIINPHYSGIVYLQQDDTGRGLFSVRNGDMYGLVRSDSAVLTPAVYSEIKTAASRFLVVKDAGRYGVIDFNGKTLHKAVFDRIDPCVENLSTVYAGKKVGLINVLGTLLVKPECDKITVVGKTVKAYRGDDLEIFWLNSAYNIAESVSYQDIPSVHVTDANARVISWDMPARRDTVKRVLYQFFFCDSLAKWGVKEAVSGRIVLEPRFDRVDQTWSTRFAMVFVNTDTIRYIIDDCRFFSMQSCGLVDMLSGTVALEPEYLDIDLTPGKYGYWFVRLINTKGEFGYANALGINIGKYRFIGNFVQRKARVNVGGELIITDMDDKNNVSGLRTFVEGFSCRLRYADAEARKKVMNERSGISCEGGYWGQLYFNLNRADFARFDWISRDYQGNFLVEMNNQSVLMHDGNFIRINGINYYKYLTTRNQQPYFIIIKNFAKYGFIDDAGRSITEMCFDQVHDFSEGYAAVRINEKWGYIGLNGELVIPARYNAAEDFREGMAAVKSGSKWGYITTSGDTVIGFQFSKAGCFNDGLAAVRRSGKSYYISTDGENAFGTLFNGAGDFCHGFAVASDRGGTGVISASGQWAVPPRYDRVTVVDARHNVAVVLKKNKYGLVSLTGEKLTPVKYHSIHKPGEGLMAARMRNSWGFIDPAGNVVIPFRYNGVQDFSCNRAIVSINGKWGAINKNNEVIIEMNYGRISSFSEGVCFAGSARVLNTVIDSNGNILVNNAKFRMMFNYTEGKAVIIGSCHDAAYADMNGDLLFGKMFTSALPFKGSSAVVKIKNQWGIIDHRGNWIVQPAYDSVHNFVEGRAMVGVTSHKGLADSRGNVCVQPEFQSVETAPYGLIRVRQNGAMGYVDISGREIWKPTK